jgi:hypothetical protein
MTIELVIQQGSDADIQLQAVDQVARRLRKIERCVSFIVFAIAISQFAYAFKPSVTIEAGPVLDVRDRAGLPSTLLQDGRGILRTAEPSLIPSCRYQRRNRP